jgi:predicted enzyme related to lactoylglutathione lyase
MSVLDFVNVYVTDAEASAGLYTQLLGTTPVSASPEFAMYVLPNGLKFGLWARRDVQPPVTGAGGAEICFAVNRDDEVAPSLEKWEKLGLNIIQQPTKMDFGLTFTAEDPDGNRLRLFAPSRRG